MANDKLTRALGWASAGLGAPLLLAPAGSAKALGITDGSRQRTALAGVGARELAAATGLLGQPGPLWLWGRVAGDLMDLALLGRALHRPGPARDPKTVVRLGGGSDRSRTIAATAAVAVITAVDVYAAASRSQRARRQTAVCVAAAVTVTRPRQEVYGRWRRFDGMPAYTTHLGHLTVTGPPASHWRGPFGPALEWDARITDDVPGERIAWRSVDGSKVRTDGAVQFKTAPDERATDIRVTLRYLLPGGRRGQALTRYFGQDPRQRLDADLLRVKQAFETDETVRPDEDNRAKVVLTP
jgi:uncharacterized membrane protein